MNLFDGIGGLIAGKAMTTLNAAAEREAVVRLNPTAGARCLVIGFGPGVGLEALLRHAAGITAVGADPSAAMQTIAGRRNAAAISEGRLELRRCTLSQVSPDDHGFDAALAVNTLQFCDPIETEAQHLAILLRPGARLMTLTHAWAFERHFGPLCSYLDRLDAAFRAAGFEVDPPFHGDAEKGTIIGFSATREVSVAR